MALILYKPLPFVEHFANPERDFQFSGIPKITIKQNWEVYGVSAVVWEAAIVLASFLTNIASDLKSKNILELGAGTGLTGIVASLLGANVTITDVKDSLDTCTANVNKNLRKDRHNFQVKPLSWGQNLNKDWSNEYFDYIIGADLVYIEDVLGDLIKTFQHFSKVNPNIKIYLSGKLRYKEKYDNFLQLAKEIFLVEDVLFTADSNTYIIKLVLEK